MVFNPFNNNLDSSSNIKSFHRLPVLVSKHALSISLAISTIGMVGCLTAAAITGSMFLIIPTVTCALIAVIIMGIKCISKKSAPIETPNKSSSFSSSTRNNSIFTIDSQKPFSSINTADFSIDANGTSSALIPPPATQRKRFDPSTLKYTRSNQALPEIPYNASINVKANREILLQEFLTQASSNSSVCLMCAGNGVTFTMARHDISTPFYPRFPLAIVNAANDTMQRGGGGTNKALSNVTSEACWIKAQEGLSSLNPGDVVGGLWESSASVPSNQDMPRALIQALGPNVKNTPAHELSDQLRVVKKAYVNILKKAAALGCSHVQLPLLSGSIFAPNPHLRAQDHEFWTQGSFRMLLEAIKELDRNSMVNNITLVDIQEPFWAPFCKLYCDKLTAS